MSFFKIGLDQMLLTSLIIALGMLVDNAIVMSESIMVQIRAGKKPVAATVDEASELRIPMLTPSLTTAAHVLVTIYGSYSVKDNFPTLLGQAFVALGMSVPKDGQKDAPIFRLDRNLFEAACAINGRPCLPTVTDYEARTTVETMGIIAERMLDLLKQRK
jgi:hypothetical protein